MTRPADHATLPLSEVQRILDGSDRVVEITSPCCANSKSEHLWTHPIYGRVYCINCRLYRWVRSSGERIE